MKADKDFVSRLYSCTICDAIYEWNICFDVLNTPCKFVHPAEPVFRPHRGLVYIEMMYNYISYICYDATLL